MRRQVILDLEARVEFEDAIAWFDAREPGLGAKFKAEVQATIQRILQDPERFPLRGRKVRRASVATFKNYKILFRIEPHFIIVAGVFHGARNPARLRRRLK